MVEGGHPLENDPPPHPKKIPEEDRDTVVQKQVRIMSNASRRGFTAGLAAASNLYRCSILRL